MKTVREPQTVFSTARISVRPENRKELCLTISSLLDPIRREPGCLAYEFFGKALDENSFLLMGEWETREALSRHLDSKNFAVLLGSITLLANVSTVDFKLLSQCNLSNGHRIRSEMNAALSY